MNAIKPQPLIPFNRPCFIGNEQKYMAEAIASGHISGDGIFTRKCHALLEGALGVKKALLTTSCTHALEMAALLLNIAPGGEVIVPSYTFVSTANAFALRGARIVFCDIRRDTLNMDESLLENLVTEKTRAIVPVHYAGVACEMDAIMTIASRHGIDVVEDNAHGLFAHYKGRPLGTFGIVATQSFHETKNFNCGEGGALLINDDRLVERAEIIREKGTDRTRFFRGQVDKYSWVDFGSSYLPSDLLAAFLMAQLEARERINTRRREIWMRYNDELADWAQQHGVSLPFVPAHCQQSWYMFHLLMPSLQTRSAFIAHMRNHGIMTVFHYLPLHASVMGKRFGAKEGDCPITEDIADRLVRLPFFHALTPDEQSRVIDAIRCFAP